MQPLLPVTDSACVLPHTCLAPTIPRRKNARIRRRNSMPIPRRTPTSYLQSPYSPHTPKFQTSHLLQLLYLYRSLLKPTFVEPTTSPQTQTVVNDFPSQFTTPTPPQRRPWNTGLQTTQHSSSFPTPSSTTPEMAHACETCVPLSILRSHNPPGWTIPSAQSLPSARSCRCSTPFFQRRLLSCVPSFLPPPIELLRQPIRVLISASPTSPSLTCSACGTTRAAVSGASAPPVFDYIH